MSTHCTPQAHRRRQRIAHTPVLSVYVPGLQYNTPHTTGDDSKTERVADLHGAWENLKLRIPLRAFDIQVIKTSAQRFLKSKLSAKYLDRCNDYTPQAWDGGLSEEDAS